MKNKLLIGVLFALNMTTASFASDNGLLDESKFTRGKTVISSGTISWIANKVTEGTPIIFIHGNSACKEVFAKQLMDPKLNQFPLIAFDLPGHGDSSDAQDPKATYSFEGYARASQELQEKLGISPAVFCGWSLGGHVAIAQAHESPAQIKGLFLTGTPPIEHTMNGMMSGFRPFEGAAMMSQETPFTEAEAKLFVTMGGINPEIAPFMVTAGQRTHGLARKNMITAAISGSGVNEKEFVTSTLLPIAFVQGKSDNGINGDYINALPIPGKVAFHTVESGHATFWEQPEIFNQHLLDFMNGLK